MNESARLVEKVRTEFPLIFETVLGRSEPYELFKKKPQDFNAYVRIGLDLLQEDWNAGELYFTKGLKVAQTHPEMLDAYAYEGLELKKMSGDTAAAFFENAPLVIEKRPHHYRYYALLGKRVMQKNAGYGWAYYILARQVMEKIPEEHCGLLIKTAEEIYEKDESLLFDYLERAPQNLQALDQTRPLDHDGLLIEYIHDPYSANMVKPLVDMNDPHVKKAYAERIRRFY